MAQSEWDDHDMGPEHLEEEEIEYEFNIRNMEAPQGARQRTDLLRQRLREEKEGKFALPQNVLVEEDDYDFCVIRVTQIRQQLKFAMLKRLEQGRKIALSRLKHYVHRAYRACDDDGKVATIDHMVHRVIRTM